MITHTESMVLPFVLFNSVDWSVACYLTFCLILQILILLDVTPDQSMLDEGLAREVINRIQKLRKKVRLLTNTYSSNTVCVYLIYCLLFHHLYTHGYIDLVCVMYDSQHCSKSMFCIFIPGQVIAIR